MNKSFNDNESKVVFDFLNGFLSEPGKRLKRPEVFDHVKDQLSGWDNAEFCLALSEAVKLGKMPGLKIVRGRYGGVSKDLGGPLGEPKAEKPVVAKQEPVKKDIATTNVSVQPDIEPAKPKAEEPKPAPSLLSVPSTRHPLSTAHSFQWVWIGESRYRVHMSAKNVHTLICEVFGLEEDSRGEVVFGGKRYYGDYKKLGNYFEKFMCLSPSTVAPLLTSHDAAGVPLNLTDVHQDPTPESLEVWNNKVACTRM